MISTRLCENFSMTDSIQISGLTCRQRKRELSKALGSTLAPSQGLDPASPGCQGGRTWAQSHRRAGWRRWCGHCQSERAAHTGGISHPPAPQTCSCSLKLRAELAHNTGTQGRVLILTFPCLLLRSPPYYRWRNWGPERMSNLLAVTQVARNRAGIPRESGPCYQDVILWALVAQLCPNLCDPIDCSPPGSSLHGILQARILEWVAIPFSRGPSWLRDWTRVSHTAGRSLPSEPPGETSTISRPKSVLLSCRVNTTWWASGL